MEGGGVGGIAPESSRVELEAKVSEKSSALAEGKTAVEPSEEIRGGKKEEAKLELTFFCKIPERARGRGASKIVTFPTEKRVFSVSENRFCTIPGGNIKSISFWSLKATVIPEGIIPAADSTRTGRVKPRLISFS